MCFPVGFCASIKIPQDPDINKFVNYYLNEDYQWFLKALKRYSLYKGIVEKILKANGCPEELALLPIVESGYNGKAISKSSAVGYWQFIKSTAKELGLKINGYIDERRDIERSTEAAAIYLKRLYNIFKDWDLALAAYNAGEGYIIRTLQKTGLKSYWELRKREILRKETKDFVPKFYAVLKILKENKVMIPTNKTKLVKIHVPGGINLKDLSIYTGTSYRFLCEINPHLLRKRTPPFGAKIYVPNNLVNRTRYAVNIILAKRKAASLGIKFYRDYWRGYIVKKGDSLWKIAKRFDVSVDLIKTLNSKNTNRLKIGEVLLIPTKKLKRHIILAKPKEKSIVYSVSQGDSLWKISRVFGVKVNTLMKLNGVRYILKPGQKLKIVLEETEVGQKT